MKGRQKERQTDWMKNSANQYVAPINTSGIHIHNNNINQIKRRRRRQRRNYNNYPAHIKWLAHTVVISYISFSFLLTAISSTVVRCVSLLFSVNLGLSVLKLCLCGYKSLYHYYYYHYYHDCCSHFLCSVLI